MGLTGRKGRSKRGPAADTTRNKEEKSDRARNGAPFRANRAGKAPQKSGAARSHSEEIFGNGINRTPPPRTRGSRAAGAGGRQADSPECQPDLITQRQLLC